ncbi:hypothetical protein IYO2065_05760 [Lactiplantibacillus plantarum]|nr:hypothetical protein IYO2065_05760 [Lactiplantibacillus plantarum]
MVLSSIVLHLTLTISTKDLVTVLLGLTKFALLIRKTNKKA